MEDGLQRLNHENSSTRFGEEPTKKNYRAAARLKAGGGKTGTNTREGGAKSKCQKGHAGLTKISQENETEIRIGAVVS